MLKVKMRKNLREIEFVIVCIICLYYILWLLIVYYIRYVMFRKGNVLLKNVLLVKKYFVKI